MSPREHLCRIGDYRFIGLERLWNLDPALTRRPGCHQRHPTLQMREPLYADAGPAMDAHPRPMGDIGNGVVVDQKLVIGKPGIEHRIEPARFILGKRTAGALVSNPTWGLWLKPWAPRSADTRLQTSIWKHAALGFLNPKVGATSTARLQA